MCCLAFLPAPHLTVLGAERTVPLQTLLTCILHSTRWLSPETSHCTFTVQPYTAQLALSLPYVYCLPSTYVTGQI